MYKNMVGEPVPEQVEAFCDSWEMDREKQELMDNMQVTMRHYEIDSDFIIFWDLWIKALRSTQPKLLAYLLYMTVRLLEMRRILKPTGSIYYHCDPTASHYIKIIMDAIFGHDNFINEIIWHYRTYQGKVTRYYPKKHDTIFWYFKNSLTKNFRLEYLDNYEDTVDFERWNKFYVNGNEIKYNFYPESDTRFKSYLDRWISQNNREPKSDETIYTCKGYVVDDVWCDIQAIDPKDKKNKLGYPTQKPVPLLNRIIKSSCPEDGVILDPFCGCGTSVYSAHENRRNWIGIDIAILSTRLVRDTLKERYGLETGKHYDIDGIPVSVEEAKFLWANDPFQFQNWAVEYVRGFCTQKKTRDSGIDGRFYFKDKDNNLQSMIISVKGGKLKASDVRDLIGTVEKEKAVFGGLISFDSPSKDMIQAAIKMGIYTDAWNNKYDRIQFLTVKDMLEDKKLFQIPNNIDRKDFSKHYQPRLYI